MRPLFPQTVLLALVLATPVGAGARCFTVRGDSMRPTLVPGDRVEVGDTEARPLRRGVLVAARLTARQHPVVKRLVALPGDRVVQVRDVLRVVADGGAEWTVGPGSGRGGGSRALLAQLRQSGGIVPPGCVVLLSDNLPVGHDSRRFGLVSTAQLLGHVRVVRRCGSNEGH